MIPWVKLNELKKRALNVIDVFLLPLDNPSNPWLLLAYAVSIEPLIFEP
jgi:hypothetical protein